MNRWWHWVTGKTYSSSNFNLFKAICRLILSIWILIIGATAIIMVSLFASNPSEMIEKKKEVGCITIDPASGETIDACDLLVP